MTAASEQLTSPLDFELPPELEAHDPPEARGRSRDDVRLMVATRHDLGLVHARFHELPRFLRRGDLLVINTSRTLPASIPAARADGTGLELHLSTPVLGEPAPAYLSGPPDPARDTWVVELRTPADRGGRSFRGARPGETLTLPEATAEILGPYPPLCGPQEEWPRESRLWTARLRLPSALGSYLERHGRPIRYGSASREWPASYYQTVYAAEAGSVEMPSAGRPFTTEMITRLIAHGIDVAPLTLHAGVASLEDHEPPLREYYRVPGDTARRVRSTRETGGRVIAVGTTVAKAGPTCWSHRPGACAASTGCSPAGTSLEPPTCSCWRRSRAASCSNAPTARRSSTATSGTSSATCTCCSHDERRKRCAA